MKKLFTIALCLLLAGYVAAQNVYPAAEVWKIPKTAVVPVIDGILDPVWFNSAEEICDNWSEVDTPLMPDDWFDLYVTGRLMWDETNLYIFISFYDDVLIDGIQTGADWNYDSAELYFDADNSKQPTPYDGIDDLQWRFNHGDTIDDTDLGWGDAATGPDPKANTEMAIEDTDLGWNLEIKVLLADLYIDPVEGNVFGFDMQVNDADVEANVRDHMYRWWAPSEPEWHDASLFGNAELTGRVISEVLDVHEIASAPVMDGQLDDVWLDIPVLSDNVFCETDPTIIDDWTDTRVWFRTAWDATNQYFFFDIWDDVINLGTDYQYDSIELYWDADNSKVPGPPFDGIDDYQFRINYGDITDADLDDGFGDATAWGSPKVGVTFGIEDTDHGYAIEMAMPLDNVQLSPDSEFGFEMQLNDADESTRDSMKRWWSTSNNSWHDASLFGTAILLSGNSVKGKDAAVAGSYALAQNYPNPFNPTTNISYTVDNRTMVKLNVYDVLGKQVASLVNEVKSPGLYTVTFDASSLTSGVYFYKLYADNKVEAKKMMLVK